MSPRIQGHLAMLLFSALVAGSFSLGSTMANDVDPAAFTAVRFWLASTFVLALVWMREGAPRGVLIAPWRYAILGGLFGLYFALMFEGLKTAPPVSTSAVFTLVPLMSAGFAWIFLREFMTKRMGLALTFGAIGALWVIFRGDLQAFLAFDIGRGEAVFFVGCFSHAIYTPLVRTFNRGESAVVSTFGTVLGGAVLFSIYAASEVIATDWSAMPARVWVTLFYTAFFATAVTVILLQFAALRLPSAKVMAYTYLVPSWVIVWEFIRGNGVPSVIVVIGVGLTALALVMLLKNDEVRRG